MARLFTRFSPIAIILHLAILLACGCGGGSSGGGGSGSPTDDDTSDDDSNHDDDNSDDDTNDDDTNDDDTTDDDTQPDDDTDDDDTVDDDTTDDDTVDDDTTEEPVAEEDVDESGGSVEVEDPESPLYGLILEIPPDALLEETTIEIFIEDSPPTTPSGFTSGGTFARFEPSGLQFDKPVWIHSPWAPLTADEAVAVGHFDEQASEWTILPAWGKDDQDRPLVIADSFSVFGGFFFDASISAATDFEPANDGFSVINRAFVGEPDGSCWGFALYSTWFHKHRSQMAADLWDAYSMPTAAHVAIDAMGLQGGYDVAFSRLAQFFGDFLPTDRSTLEALIAAMRITGRPQPVILKTGWFSPGGHVVVATGWDGENLDIYDPNRPGQSRTIHWNGFNFDAYGSYDTFFAADLETFLTEDGMQDVHDDHGFDGPADCEDCAQSMEYLYDLKGLQLNSWSETQAIAECNSGSDADVWSCVQDCVCEHAMTSLSAHDMTNCIQACPDFGGGDDDTTDDDTTDDDTTDDDTADDDTSDDDTADDDTADDDTGDDDVAADSPWDTGQTACYDANQEIPCPAEGESYYGQDAQYGQNTMDYTIHDNFTVTHNNTGLMWERQLFYNSYTFDQASSYCAGATIGGFGDWRLPSRLELMTLVDYGRGSPSLDTSIFPNTESAPYWTQTSYAGSTDTVWHVHFVDGSVSASSKTSLLAVRCVRRSIPACEPDCAGRECGGDGCDGSCGECLSGEECMSDGLCDRVCWPDCAGKECGADGCGGDCGYCFEGEQCNPWGLCDPAFDHAATLPDTNQYLCYDASTEIECPDPGESYFGQDAQYDAPMMSFRPTAETVDDAVTGLTWERRLRNNSFTYAQAEEYCAWLVLEGYSDWRLPSRLELMTMVDYSISSPAADPHVFPMTASLPYWTLTAYAGSADTVWHIHFSDGSISASSKTSLQPVRCVRGAMDPCEPDCTGRECGGDGCAGSCGDCASGEECSAGGQCISVCDPDCAGRECGPDGCGGDCGYCASGDACDGGGNCEPALYTPYWLPDTGQEECYDANMSVPCPSPGESYYGQDTQYDGPKMSLRATATIVEDNVTGLRWERHLAYNSTSLDEASAYCARLVLGGLSNWRLPTRLELVTIVNYGLSNPAVDVGVFPDTEPRPYWTQTAYAGSADTVWHVEFTDGSVSASSETTLLPVRCIHD